MANFNYLDFFKTPSETDKKLFIKDKNNNVVWTLSNFMIKNYFVQNNNIRINFTNEDFIIIDFNNIYESKIALSKLKDAISILNNKVPFEIDKDIKLYVDTLVENSIFSGPTGPTGYAGATGPIGPTGSKGDIGFSGKVYTSLTSSGDYSIINSPTSFTYLNSSDNTSSFQTIESFDNSQGFYLQTTLPMAVDNLYGISLGAYGMGMNSYSIKIFSSSYDALNPITDYSLYYDTDEIFSGTYSEPLRFSLYSDGKDVFYEFNGITLAKYKYNSDSYYFYSYLNNILADNYTFDNFLFYPTGKKGIPGDRYYATSSTYITIPEIEGVIILDIQSELSYTPGQWLFISNTLDSYYTVGDYFEDDSIGINFYAIVENYNYETGELTTICEKTNSIGLTGSNWYINLSGMPGVDGQGLSFSTPYLNGILTSDGTSNGVNIETNLKYDGHTFSVIGDTILKGTTQFQQTIEIVGTSSIVFGLSPSTITYDFTVGSIWYHYDLVDNYFADFINVPTIDNRAISINIIINQGSTAYVPTFLSINGTIYDISWANGNTPTGNANQTDVIGFTFVNFGGIFRVLGQISTFLSTLPIVTSDGISSGFPCVANGTVTSEGGSPVTERGYVYGNVSYPTIADNKVIDISTGTGSFSVDISVPSYPDSYGRAYAINNSGVAYGVNIPFSAPCFIKGTLVTLSNGKTKKIEDINYNDSLLVWNFDDSRFDSANPVWIMKPVTISDSFITKFSDGSELITAGKLGVRKTSHRIFNIESGKFTYLISEKDTPIGTSTFNDKGEIVTLISREQKNELTEIYNVVTFGHLNMFCNTLLTSVRLNNIYPIKDMKFIKDKRSITPYDKFEGISKNYYYGFRLGEQILVEKSENFIETNTTPTLDELTHHMKTYYK